MNSLNRDYFDKLYRAADDPWHFATSAYEREKYDRSLAALRDSYERALEIGCSIGVFTQRLARRCEELLALDISERAIAQARVRCAHEPHVRFERAMFPHDVPAGTFDLVTVCEVGYYWSDSDLAAARDRIAAALRPAGQLLLVHFLPHVDDYVREGDAVHAEFLADRRFERGDAFRADRYRIDVLSRR